MEIHQRKSSNHKSNGFTLVEIMIVVLIIGILLAIAVPNFVQARETTRSKACIQNLREIDTAKQQWMIDQKSSIFTSYQMDPNTTTSGVLALYIHTVPHCPEAGYYETGNEIQLPICVTTSNGSTVTGSNITPYSPHQLT